MTGLTPRDCVLREEEEDEDEILVVGVGMK